MAALTTIKSLRISLATVTLALGGVVWPNALTWAESVPSVPLLPLVEPEPLNPSGPEVFPRGELEVVSLTLTDLIALTLAGNRTLQNQTLDRIVQRQQLAAAEQEFNPRFTPTLRLDAAHSRLGNGGILIDDTEAVLLPSGTTDFDQQVLLNATLATRIGTSFELGLTPFEGTQLLRFSLTQPLLRGFGAEINEIPLNQARLSETSNQLALRQAVGDTITQAILGYNTLLNAQSQVEIQTQALGRRQRQLDISQALVRAGRLASIELFEPERAIADAQRSLVDAQNQLDQANNALLNLIGTDRPLRFVASVDTVQQLYDAAAVQIATYDPETLVALALDNRVDYRQAQLQRQQQELAQRLAQDNLRWRLDAVADGIVGDGSRSAVGLVATRTFGDPTPETARLTSDIALQQQANILAQLQDQIRNDVIAGLAEARSSLQQVEAAERATLNARLQVQGDRARSSGDLFQIISQEEILVTAETNELAARIAFLNSVALLEQTVGVTVDRWGELVEVRLE